MDTQYEKYLRYNPFTSDLVRVLIQGASVYLPKKRLIASISKEIGFEGKYNDTDTLSRLPSQSFYA